METSRLTLKKETFNSVALYKIFNTESIINEDLEMKVLELCGELVTIKEEVDYQDVLYFTPTINEEESNEIMCLFFRNGKLRLGAEPTIKALETFNLIQEFINE